MIDKPLGAPSHGAHSHSHSDTPMVNCIAYGAEGQRVADLALDDVAEFLRHRQGFIWIGLHEPAERLLRQVQNAFGLHELAVEDALKAHQRPKLEVYGNSLFLVVHTAQELNGVVKFGETHAFIGERFLLTVRHGASLPYVPVRARCEQMSRRLAVGPSFGLYGVLDFVVDNYAPIVRSFEQQLFDLEQRVFETSFHRETIQRLYRLKRELVRLRMAVAPIQDITIALVELHPELIHSETRVYFRDVHDHAVRTADMISTLGEMLSAALQVNLALVTVGQNEVVKRLAGWAGLAAIPTLVASVYGMNFDFMPELHWRFGYPTVLALTGVLCLIAYRLLRRAKWL